MVSKKSIYSRFLFLTLGALVPVTSFADDGIATNDALITQPTSERGTTGSSTSPIDGDLARSNDSNTGATMPTASAVPEVPATPETPTTSATPADKLDIAAPVANTETKETPQTSEVPSAPVVTVTPSASVETAAGQTIVSKQNSQVIIANTDGTTSVVTPEVVGFKVNTDGTLTGKEVTLPKTGEESPTFLTLVGTFFLAAAFLGFKKRA